MRKNFSNIDIKKLREKLRREQPERLAPWRPGSTMYASRSAAEFWGWNWPENIACMRAGEYITYEQLKQEKLEKQKQQLELKRRSDKPRKIPVFVETFYNDPKKCWPYAGWWTYIYTSKHNRWTVDFRGTEWLIEPVMQAFPLGFLPFQEMYYDWMQVFSQTYPNSKHKAWAWIQHNRIIKLEAV